MDTTAGCLTLYGEVQEDGTVRIRVRDCFGDTYEYITRDQAIAIIEHLRRAFEIEEAEEGS